MSHAQRARFTFESFERWPENSGRIANNTEHIPDEIYSANKHVTSRDSFRMAKIEFSVKNGRTSGMIQQAEIPQGELHTYLALMLPRQNV